MTLCDVMGTTISCSDEKKGTEEGCKELHVPYQRIDQHKGTATSVSATTPIETSGNVSMINPPTASSSSSSTYHHRNHRHQSMDPSATEKPELTPLMNMLASVSIHSALMTQSTTDSDEENDLPPSRSRAVGGRSTKGKTLFRELRQPPPGGAATGPLSSIGKPYRQVFNLSPFNKGNVM